jgi:hypothetical protein
MKTVEEEAPMQDKPILREGIPGMPDLPTCYYMNYKHLIKSGEFIIGIKQ